MRCTTRYSRVTVVALALLGWAPTTGADEPLHPAATAERGRRLFSALCSGCHGTRGDGRGPVADALFPRPRDLTRGEYRFRSTPSGQLPTRFDLRRTLRVGLPGTPMPGWGPQLDAREIDSLVLVLEQLSPRFAKGPPPEVLVDEAALSPPPVTDAVLVRGREVYEKMRCGKCHGETGRGDGKAAPTLKNNDGEEADVFDFSYGVYKGGYDAAAVYRNFVTGLDGTPMPSYADALPDEADRWALVHYCRSLTRDRGAWFWLSERPTWEEPMSGGP